MAGDARLGGMTQRVSKSDGCLSVNIRKLWRSRGESTSRCVAKSLVSDSTLSDEGSNSMTIASLARDSRSVQESNVSKDWY